MSALYAWLSVEVGLRISFTLIIKDPRIVQYKNSLRHRRSRASVRDEQRSRKEHGLRCSVETGRIGGIKGRGIGECGKRMVFHSNVAHLGAKTVAQKGV